MKPLHLVINNLSHHFGNDPKADNVINSIDLSLSHGEILGLLGPSGCGKTTLLRLIAGFEKPCEGNIFFNGEMVSSPVYILPPERRGIGMVFQDYALFPHLDVWENICFGVNLRKDNERVHWLLDLLGLSDLKDRFPHELSGGQKQRLGLGRALAPGNSLVVLDEPFSNLDVEVRHLLRNELPRVLKSCDASAILVTHDPHEALGICDRVGVMRAGDIQQCSSPIELLTKPKNPFIGNFVSQNNLVNISFNNGLISTPFGSVLYKSNLITEEPRILMLDEESLQIRLTSGGTSKIIGKEFKNTYWIMRVKAGKEILRISVPIDLDINIGDLCEVRFISGKYAYLYPGCISCILKNFN